MTENNNKRRKPQRRLPVGKLIRRIVISFLLSLVLIFLLVWTAIFAIAHGPSDTMRDLLVGMAMQASATKWVPNLVLAQEDIDDIMNRSAAEEDYTPTNLEERYIKKIITNENGERIEITVLQGDDGTAVVTDESGSKVVEYNEWDYAIDGIQFITLNRANFKAYMLIIKDPSRVYIGTSSDYSDTSVPGKRFYEMAEQENCVAMINSGEFSDPNGQGNGGQPLGLTYSKGKCVMSNDYLSWKTFIGFTNDNKLIVEEGLTQAAAEAKGIRDGVCFRPGYTYGNKNPSSRLIYTDDDGQVHVSTYGDLALSQRCAIGQRADGAVIFLVTDGRSAESIGASFNDVTQIMYEYGAVCAGMLDGGSSAMLYYRNYFDLYNYDKSKLDEYQQMGLVNNYVAATTPRRIPTYFCVSAGGAQ